MFVKTMLLIFPLVSNCFSHVQSVGLMTLLAGYSCVLLLGVPLSIDEGRHSFYPIS